MSCIFDRTCAPSLTCFPIRREPQVFIAGKHIGGADAVQALHDQGKLHDLLIGRVGWATYILPAGLVFVIVAFIATVYFTKAFYEAEERQAKRD